MPVTPTNYLNTPLVYTRNIAPFRRLLEGGKTQTIRFVELGDSQATTPGGYGDPWNFEFNRALADLYGNAPETRLNAGGNFGAFGSFHSTQGEWGVAGRSAISPAVSTTPASELLPTMIVNAVQSTVNYQSGQLGIFLMNNISAPCMQARNNNYFDYSGGVYQKTYAFTRSGASPMTIGNAYNATHAHNFTLSDFQTNINFGQDSASLAVVSHTSNLMTAPTSSQYLQSGLKLTSGAGPIEVFGWRYIMGGTAGTYGSVMDSYGIGGSRTDTYLTAVAGAGKQLKGSGPYHCAIISFGANDMALNDQATFKANVLAIINFVRASMNDPSFPIIITTDYQRVFTGGTAAADRARYQSYPIAAWELANEQTAVMAVNLQRLTYMFGWTEADMTFTGLVNRGAWSSAAVAYAVNDYVVIDAFPGATNVTTRGELYYKCVAAHNSTVGNGPVDSQYWVPICRMSTSTDGVHFNYWAGPIAKAAVDLIVQGAYGIGSAGIAGSGGAGVFGLRDRPWIR